MIKLSDMLIATLDDKDPLIALQINEAKRLEALDVPRVEAERKPIVDAGDGLYVVWSNGKCIGWSSHRGAAKAFADKQASETGQPHTVAQVMAPVYGRCPTIPVATFTPERPHEWVVYSANTSEGRHWHSHCPGDTGNYWHYSVTDQNVKRFATCKEAQSWIESRGIADAYPWPVPKLNTAS